MASLSEPSRKRLLYLEFLLHQKIQQTAEREQTEGRQTGRGTETTITSREIARLTGCTDATVRRDISTLGIRCGAAKGYPVRELREAIACALGSKTEAGRRCCIVGLGKIGAALLDYGGFVPAGFRLVAGFDQSVNRVEVLNASFPLYPASRLEQVIQQESIEYAVLAVPDELAADYGQRLAQAGIRGIVNYTNALLSLPPQVKVANVSVIHSLRHLVAEGLA